MSDSQNPRLIDLRPHTVVRLPDGTAARLIESSIPRIVEVLDRRGQLQSLNAGTRVTILALPEQTAEAFLQALPDTAAPDERVEYGIVIPWGGQFKPTDIRGETAEAVLDTYALRNPLDAPADPTGFRRSAYVARYLGQDGMQLSFGSWQPIIIQDGLYRLGPDEGPRTITVSPFELGG